jgi:serine/threonine protein kinase
MIKVGDILEKKYEITGLLGAGGMAQVYLARDLELDREVAVKALARDKCHIEELARCFIKEAKNVAKLNHPNIVTIYAIGTTEDADRQPYFIIEFYGRSLAERLNSFTMTLEEKLRLMIEVLKALEYSHKNKVVHRDVKPENIMFKDSGEAVLIDFGISRSGDASCSGRFTQNGTTRGTPKYMSPEQCRGESLDGRSDLYSAGIVLYEMLCGTVPFDKPELIETMHDHIKIAPDYNKLEEIDVPKKLRSAVKRSLMKRPDDRFQNAGEFIAEIERTLSAERRQSEPAVRHNKNDMDKIHQPSTMKGFKQNISILNFFKWLILLVIIIGAFYCLRDFRFNHHNQIKSGHIRNLIFTAAFLAAVYFAAKKIFFKPSKIIVFVEGPQNFLISRQFAQRTVLIGRDDCNDVVLHHPPFSDNVSRKHAFLEVAGNKVRIVDNGSKIGVFVNEKPARKSAVKFGDIIKIGVFTLRVEIIQ